MTRQDFISLYANYRPGLDRARAELDRLLSEGLNDLYAALRLDPAHKAGPFRIRLKEARVKDAESLFDKIAEDALDPSRAFEPKYVPDLIGARIVCHNLKDVEQLALAFKQNKIKGLHYFERPTGPKNWLHEPHPLSGYRGWHIDVEWIAPTQHGSDCAEIQIRTLLQDAWASFMHDDVHKTKARLMLTHESYTRFVEFSHLLYVADRIAQGMRNTVEAARVSDVSTIKRVEALNKAMFFMVNFLAQSHQTTRFTVISRCDEYVVDRNNPIFRFAIDGKSAKAERFCMEIGGDTPNNNFTLLKFKSNARDLTASDYKLQRGAELGNKVVLCHAKSRKKQHKYWVECVWKGVFDEGREYVWCPWSHLYRDAAVAYSLNLRFINPPVKKPILYRVREYKDLESILNAFELGGGGLEPEDKNDLEYQFRPDRACDDFLCLFGL